MIVICKMIYCPYYDNKGFCGKPIAISIDENGMCNVLWRNGQQRKLMPTNDDTYYKKENIEIAEIEVSEVQQSKNKEEGGSVKKFL